MTSCTKEIKKGDILLIEDGEYSDYEVEGIYKANQDIDINEWKEKFKCIKKRNFSGGSLFSYMYSQNLFTELKYKAIHYDELCCYDFQGA